MNKTINQAKKILSDICKKYKHHDKDIMQSVEGERLHSLDVLNRVEKLNPNPSLALQLGALFHDIDGIVTPKAGGGFKGDRNSKEYFQHKKEHAKRSADFIIPLLKEIISDKKTREKKRFLIIHHDDRGSEVEKINNPDLNHLVSADSFAFFTSIAPKLYSAEGKERIKDKIRFMIEKLPDFARIQLWERQLENKVFNNLKNEIIKEYYTKNNPREKEYKFCPSCKAKLVRKNIDRRNLLSCSLCGFVFWNNPKPVVSVILEKNGKVLLIKRKKEPLKGYWCLPGGYVDYEEKPEEAIVREAREETNLEVKPTRIIGVYQIDNDPSGINLDIIYKGLIIGGKLKLNDESSEYEFFSLNKLPKLIAYKHREAIMDYLKLKNKT